MPKDEVDDKTTAKAIAAADSDPAPTSAASAGRQPDKAPAKRSARATDSAAQASIPVKERLFAHPSVAGARDAGGTRAAVRPPGA